MGFCRKVKYCTDSFLKVIQTYSFVSTIVNCILLHFVPFVLPTTCFLVVHFSLSSYIEKDFLIALLCIVILGVMFIEVFFKNRKNNIGTLINIVYATIYFTDIVFAGFVFVSDVINMFFNRNAFASIVVDVIIILLTLIVKKRKNTRKINTGDGSKPLEN